MCDFYADVLHFYHWKWKKYSHKLWNIILSDMYSGMYQKYTEVASLAQYQHETVGDNEMAELYTLSDNELVILCLIVW